MERIFIIEDDPVLLDELARLLELQGFATATCSSFESAAREVIDSNPACAVLDLKLPGADGLAICRDIRQETQVPIIMLTSSASEFDEVMALGLGANDYVTKPYRPAVLLARIQSVLRSAKSSLALDPVLECEGVRLDCSRATMSFQNASIELSKNELRIMSMLMQHAGTIVSRQDIMCELWESDEFVDDNTLTVNVNRLRKSLERIGVDPHFVKTSRGFGYSVGNQA